jgi:hypothetical protein
MSDEGGFEELQESFCRRAIVAFSSTICASSPAIRASCFLIVLTCLSISFACSRIISACFLTNSCKFSPSLLCFYHTS